MSTPNPLIPQGTFQSQAARGASNVRIAVATIVAIHVVFFGGLLLQGCKRDTKVVADSDADTNAAASLTLPPIDTGTLYYPTPSSLPADDFSNTGATATASAPPTPTSRTDYATTSATPSDPWQPSNFGTQVNVGAFRETAASAPLREYTVVAGDNFTKIAKAHGTTVNAIVQSNPGVEPNRIRPGMKIKLPPPAPAGSAPAQVQGELGPQPGSGTIYTVKAGDNLTRIAQNHGVTINQIRAANNLKTTRVNIGQKLVIPKPQTVKTSNGAPTNVTF